MSKRRLNTEETADLLATVRWQQPAHDADDLLWLKARKVQKARLGGKPSGGNESRRIEAVNLLVSEYQLQVAEYKRKERAEIDPLLLQGIKEWGLYIFAQENPEIALARFLGKKQKPGKRATNTERHRDIALAVIEEMDGGAKFEKAIESVATEYGLEVDTVKKIYGRWRKELRADRALKFFEKKDKRPSKSPR
jgi:hypothetical protein